MEVQLKDGLRFCVSDSLETISTWCALEQEDWFERELSFLRFICRPEWNVIDVGANHGIYSLALAHQGVEHVWAFEPTSEPIQRFRQSVSLNRLEDRITVLQQALSDSERTGTIYLGHDSELSSAKPLSLSSSACVEEMVSFVSLDFIAARMALPSIDFIKLDAEGEEQAILDGGKHFFASHSPLVQFEFVDKGHASLELVRKFRSIGYGIYVLVPGLSCLIYLAEGCEESLDAFTLNLFACKPDRAVQLERAGALVAKNNSESTIAELPCSASELLLAMPMLDDELRAVWRAFEYDNDYGQALLAWCSARDEHKTSGERFAMLLRAQHCLVLAVQHEDHHPAVALLLSRVFADLGCQESACATVKALLEQLEPHDIPVDRPVPPVSKIFDYRQPVHSLSLFFYESALEYQITSVAFSGIFLPVDPHALTLVMRSPERTAEMERRVVLDAASGSSLLCGGGLRWLFGDAENGNRELWLRLADQYGFYKFEEGATADDLIQQGDRDFTESKYLFAMRRYFQALDQQPESVDGLFKLGLSLMRLERRREAADYFSRALRIRPAFWPACNNLGLVLSQLRDYSGAEKAYRNGLAENAENFDLHFNLASLLKDTGRNIEALYFLRQAEKLRADMACVYDLIGSTLILLSRTHDAIPMLLRAVELEPKWAQAWNNLGRCYFIRGDLDEADRCYREAVINKPDFLPAWTNRVMTMNYRSNDPAAVFNLHRQYGEKARELVGVVDSSRWRVVPDKTRRLRIGFVSGDFRRHSVSYFIEGVLKNIDRKQFEPYAYFTHEYSDQRTLEFKPLFSLWRDVKHLSDSELAARIAGDRIDILVDLIGHTTGTRLGVFAEKPAPVQLTWIGYPNTTGLDSIDYRLTDAVVDPEGEAEQYCTEVLYRLPRPFLCYTPPSGTPSVSELPFLENGYITFGSFNSRFKLGDETLFLWSRVLQACPGSRMIIKSPVGLSDEEARETLSQKLVALGVDAGRIDVRSGIEDGNEHLALYNNIDIALDPYPYHGTTTTFEALWMGVPVVTLAGGAHVSRVGVSILTNLGIPELIASSRDEYVSIATDLADDCSRLQFLRSQLRDRLESSSLLDAEAMSVAVGVAWQEMWGRFCDSPAADVLSVNSITATPLSLIKLNIGGTERRAGWKILDTKPHAHVDFVQDVRDLSNFEEGSCTEIYCSHVLQHLGQGDILSVLNSLYRLLVPGGVLRLSVPDLDTLAWLFVNPHYQKSAKFEVMRRIFGGQLDEFDFHNNGLNFDFLVDYLRDVGFSSIDHVESLELFEDAIEEASFNGVPVSLNLIAKK